MEDEAPLQGGSGAERASGGSAPEPSFEQLEAAVGAGRGDGVPGGKDCIFRPDTSGEGDRQGGVDGEFSGEGTARSRAVEGAKDGIRALEWPLGGAGPERAQDPGSELDTADWGGCWAATVLIESGVVERAVEQGPDCSRAASRRGATPFEE